MWVFEHHMLWFDKFLWTIAHAHQKNSSNCSFGEIHADASIPLYKLPCSSSTTNSSNSGNGSHEHHSHHHVQQSQTQQGILIFILIFPPFLFLYPIGFFIRLCIVTVLILFLRIICLIVKLDVWLRNFGNL